MSRPSGRKAGWVLVILALGLAACSGQPSAAARPVRKLFTLTPRTPAVTLGFLTAQLLEVTIRDGVDSKGGGATGQPDLHATLLVRNRSADQSARLIRGRLIYLDAKGQRIPLPRARGSTSFDFPPFDTRLAPGRKTSLVIDVPFPRTGLQPNTLRSVRLSLTYLPTPFLRQAANVPVAVKG